MRRQCSPAELQPLPDGSLPDCGLDLGTAVSLPVCGHDLGAAVADRQVPHLDIHCRVTNSLALQSPPVQQWITGVMTAAWGLLTSKTKPASLTHTLIALTTSGIH